MVKKKPAELSGRVECVAEGLMATKVKSNTLPRNLKPLDNANSLAVAGDKKKGGILPSPAAVRRPLAAVKNLGQEAETGLRNGLRAVSSAGKRLTESLRPSRGTDTLPRSWLTPPLSSPAHPLSHLCETTTGDQVTDFYDRKEMLSATIQRPSSPNRDTRTTRSVGRTTSGDSKAGGRGVAVKEKPRSGSSRYYIWVV
jgi:hypothetical protein